MAVVEEILNGCWVCTMLGIWTKWELSTGKVWTLRERNQD
jgi:hypothetical protein